MAVMVVPCLVVCARWVVAAAQGQGLNECLDQQMEVGTDRCWHVGDLLRFNELRRRDRVSQGRGVGLPLFVYGHSFHAACVRLPPLLLAHGGAAAPQGRDERARAGEPEAANLQEDSNR